MINHVPYWAPPTSSIVLYWIHNTYTLYMNPVTSPSRSNDYYYLAYFSSPTYLYLDEMLKLVKLLICWNENML